MPYSPAGDALRSEEVEAVRQRLLDELLENYESAKISGLCCEGAFEVAVGAVRGIPASDLVAGGVRDEPRAGA